VLIGPPAAGKSTWARARFLRTQIVNLDTWRGAVCDDTADQEATADAVAIEHLVLAARCRRRRLTVVDATNLRPDVRELLLNYGRRHYMFTVAVVFDVPPDVLVDRDEARANGVGEAVIRKMEPQFRGSVGRPRNVAGFDQTVWITPGGQTVYGKPCPAVFDAVWLR
jgi:protein phosphatase